MGFHHASTCKLYRNDAFINIYLCKKLLTWELSPSLPLFFFELCLFSELNPYSSESLNFLLPVFQFTHIAVKDGQVDQDGLDTR